MLVLARRILDYGDLVSTTEDAQLQQLVRASEAMLLEGLAGQFRDAGVRD
jgi:hypothetical protein